MMDLDTLRNHLLSQRRATEETPFGPEYHVYKVMGKMFAILAWTESPLRITLKCDPQFALALRATYPAVQPGYHCNKRHWNTITLDGSVPDHELLTWIDDSYALVVKGLPKYAQEVLTKQA